MDLKVIEPIKNYINEFNSPVEFNLFYAKHKDEIDSLTTHKLNKMYHIEGYRITKIKGELMLKKDPKLKMKEKEEAINEEINEEINELKSEIKEIRDTVNKIIEFLNSNLQGITNVSPPVTT